MRLITLFVVAFSLGACSHQFDPPFGEPGPLTDHDRDSGAASDGLDGSPDGPAGKTDFESPSNCGIAVTPDAGAGDANDCTRSAGWVCAAPCVAYARLACFKDSTGVREIRCDDKGRCECVVNGGNATYCPTGPPLSGRFGCNRAREALLSWGCCAP